jgi:alginate O-acetyltransferase complex protein AlgJ
MNRVTDNQPSRRARADWVLIAVFLFLLWAPTLDSFFDLDHSRRPGENRLPAPFPKWHEASLVEAQKYISGLDDYFSDHFGFRKQLIHWFQRWKIGLYHDHSVYKVLIGPNHWLFLGEEGMIEHFLGIMKFTPQELQAWQRVLEKRRDWLAARGVKYLFVVAPDKQDIYPEELPAWLRNAAPASRETKLDQFLKYMQEHSTVEVLDLRPPLLAAKKTAPTYLQNDTHWNWFGGFVACQEVVKTLTKQFPDLPPLRLEDFTWTNAPGTGGDLARMLGSDAPERNNFSFTPKPSVISPKLREMTNCVSAWDVHKQAFISENPAPLLETAVVFHDSFGAVWRPFLGHSIKRIVFMSENREFNLRVILENRPRIVVNEVLERYFNMQNPQELLTHDGLP